MRTITDHIVEGDSANHQLTITVTDEPGAGGANHEYEIECLTDGAGKWPSPGVCEIYFQKGPIKEFGVNGVTQEALLAIVIDRLRSFQAGPFACGWNAEALEDCEHALFMLQTRTRQRIERGLEGTYQA